jgi:hypothetical protein
MFGDVISGHVSFLLYLSECLVTFSSDRRFESV